MMLWEPVPQRVTIMQFKVEITAPIYLDCHCGRGNHVPAGGQARQGFEAVPLGRDCGEGKGQGDTFSCRPETRCDRLMALVCCRPHRFLHSLGHSINKKLGIKIAADTMEGIYRDVFRGIRTQIAALLDGLDPKDLATMSLGLSHSLSRYAKWCTCYEFMGLIVPQVQAQVLTRQG